MPGHHGYKEGSAGSGAVVMVSTVSTLQYICVKSVLFLVAKMQHAFFRALVFICLFTLMCVIAVLLYTSSAPVLDFHPSDEDTEASSGLERIIKQELKNLRNMMITEKKVASDNLSKSLQPCPDVPPKLVGPLFIAFDQHRTMDGVRKEVGSSLQEGGRFKPPNCLSLQKVGEWKDERWMNKSINR